MNTENVKPVDTLQNRQIRCLERLLNLNHELEELEDQKASNELPLWKVLIFDKPCSEIISTVLHVSDLRKHGVTVHMNIKANRQPISDVPAIYFVQPTRENVELIIRDLSNGLYESAYVCFSTTIPRALLEDFAEMAASSNTGHMINQVYDEYLNFVSLDSEFFSLQQPGVFSLIHSPSSTDGQIEETIQQVASGLFSVLVTLDVLPIIRCPPGSAAELLAKKLNQKLRDHAMNTKNVYAADSTKQRPVLILLDRTVDLVPMLNHSWTYQALVHDVLKMRLNRISVDVVNNGVESKMVYDLAPNDSFWEQNSNLPFPRVAESIDEELTRYKNDANEVTKKTGVSSIEDVNADTLVNSTYLKAAVSLLPELTARKQMLDMHMNIATALLKTIKDHQLDEFFEMESDVKNINKATVLACLKDKQKGTAEDKLRFLLIWYLNADNVPASDMEQFEEALKEAECSLEPLNFVKKIREITRMNMMASAANQPTSGQTGDNLFKGFTSLSNKLTDRFKEAGIGGLENLISGVKNLIPARRANTITSIVQSLTEPGSAIKQTEQYLYFDPKSRSGSSESLYTANKRQSFNEAIVFMIGGGNYLEYGSLTDWASEQNPKKRIVYGSTEVETSAEFLQELATIH
ncbi:SNARE binding protein Sly1 [Schizosaccharomyces japonicus yFS275]|uniref:SNARE binding protein Sly1 n=1 Tax=Schizosaccharomyces japonicus (strain yFS275 / FY16936) TaxID=402676 RepID=B6K4E3_SCHJY|nr:SNARE binding protein Sly1 [Schizosaccharomyces japonicus yFS275]EEB08350.2 SNARE binding protein Sly1 [Schizosaccharomyces japonicus yFS275]